MNAPNNPQVSYDKETCAGPYQLARLNPTPGEGFFLYVFVDTRDGEVKGEPRYSRKAAKERRDFLNSNPQNLF